MIRSKRSPGGSCEGLRPAPRKIRSVGERPFGGPSGLAGLEFERGMYHFVDLPRPLGLEDYERAIGAFTDRTMTLPGVRSVYQVGQVSDPGISDLDFLVVFEEGSSHQGRPLDAVPEEDRSMILHAPFGISEEDLDVALRYAPFFNYRHLAGDDLDLSSRTDIADADGRLLAQLALEYVLQLYVNLVIQATYSVFKLRGFFLHVKAMAYDLELLGVDGDEIGRRTDEFIAWRRSWFDAPVEERRLAAALEPYQELVRSFLADQIATRGFYLAAREFRLAPNLTLVAGDGVGCHHGGPLLPAWLRFLGGRYFKIQHRLHRFRFEVPIETESAPPVLQRRAERLASLKNRREAAFPHFLSPASSLNV